jgi:LCP family protein required for cell wall assembly
MIKRAIALTAVIAGVVAVLPFIGASVPSLASSVVVGKVHASFQPNTGQVFILVIGNDARSGNPDAALADAIHVVGINTKTMKGGILNFPRDSWVDIPGHGTAKINESLVDGGPELVAKTVESLTGIHLDYWVMTGFQGFVHIVNRIGPVNIKIPFPLYDPTGSGAAFSKGVHAVHGMGALTFVRDRHNFPNGDIDRTTNQAKFLLDLLKRLRSQVARNPATLLKWISVGRAYTRFALPADEMFRLGVLATQLTPAEMGIRTVPVTYGMQGAESVVYISSAARAIYAHFKKHASL